MRKSKALRNFWYKLSVNQRFMIRKLYYLPKDTWDGISGKRHKYVPPRGSIYTGSPASSEEYLKQGEQQLRLLKEDISLQPTDHVLDIGSGIGRTAIALTGFLENTGSYRGFDVVKTGVDWCNNKIGKNHSNFKFTYVPLFNDLYNSVATKASEFTFPYEDNSVNKIFSFSVFTHMGIEDIQHYFVEMKRVLKPDGLCFSTFFVYDDASEEHIATREGFNFPYKHDGYRLMNEKVTAGNIAIHKDKLKEMLANANMELVKLEEGFWSKPNQTGREYQDIVVFK